MKKTIKIKNEINIPDKIIGISSQISDYHVAWKINNILGLNLFKLSDKVFIDKDSNKKRPLNLYYYKDNSSQKYYLLENNSEGISIFLSLKHLDYLLILDPETEYIKHLVSILTESKSFLGCFLVELNNTQIKQLKGIMLK